MDDTNHLGESSRSHHVASMHKSVEMPSTLLYLLSHVVVHLHIEDIGDQVERILIVLHLSIQSSQIESIREVVFVDFAEVLIAA